MNVNELKAELSIRTIELEQSLDAGLPHADIIEIYRQMKELQYQLAMAQVKETQPPPAETIE